jgi:putative ABC transport system ATP-binding protein
MDKSVFRFIWRFSKRGQLSIVALVLLSLPFYFLSLDLPKTIVNKAILGKGLSDEGQAVLSLDLLGLFGEGAARVEVGQVWYLVLLSFAFLALVIINGLFKLSINTAKGRLGERMLRRLRFMLFDRILRFPIPHFRKVKAPELATMVKDEIEPLGGFIGDAYVQPIFLGGQTLTALLFIISQNFWLGLLAGAIAGFQAYLIPRLRAPILELGRARQLTARDLAGRIGEAVDGIEQIHVNDTGRFERADLAGRLGRIFSIRFELYQKKFSVKFINNMLSQLTPFLFYLIGGYLAIKGLLDVGQLIAVIVAYKDLPGPMKELIDWDQRRQDTQIKYEQVVTQFDPKGLADPALSLSDFATLEGPLTLTNVTVAEAGARPVVDHVSVTMALNETVAMMGPGASRVIEAIARLRPITTGKITFGSRVLSETPNSVFGRSTAYLGNTVYLRGPTVFDALAYPLKRRPSEGGKADGFAAQEAKRAGNPDDDAASDWIDYAAAGTANADELRDKMLEALGIVEMEDDLFRWGLREVVQTQGSTSQSILRARRAVAQRLARDQMTLLVEPFDINAFNGNATIAENLRFGAATDAQFSDAMLASNGIMQDVLRRTDLFDPMVRIGRSIGEMLLEIFQDVSAGNPLIEQFSFVDAEELQRIRTVLERDEAEAGDDARFIALAFSYVDARHRLAVLSADLRAQIVQARAAFRRAIESGAAGAVAFYDVDAPTVGVRLIDDILHGRISNGVARAHETVEALIFEALDAEHLLPVVLNAGLGHHIGIGGKRLSASQRQRIGLAQTVLRRPDVLLLNDAMIVVDEEQARRILTRVVSLRKGKATFAALARPQYANIFDRRISFEDGRLLVDELQPSTAEPAPSRSELDDEVAVLAQTSLFASFEPATLKLLAFASRRVTFMPGQDVFRQGDRADCAYVVISGTASVLVASNEGVTEIATVGKNHFVGEIAILSDGERTATVRASSELIALEIDREMFLRLIRDFPDIAIEVMRDLSLRLRQTTTQVVEAHEA